MPVSARIADIVKREAGDQADEIGKQSKPAKSAKAIEQSLKQESSSNEPASSVQVLSFSSEIKTDTSIAAAVAGRVKRKNEAIKQSKEAKRAKRSNNPSDRHTVTQSDETTLAESKYQRATPLAPKIAANLKGKEKKIVSRTQALNQSLVTAAAQHELLELPVQNDSGLTVAESDRTWRVSQAELRQTVDSRTAAKAFDLQLEHGPYRVDYTRDGRHMLIGGSRGQISLMEWEQHKLLAEFDVKEQVRDVAFLHSHDMFAVAQKSYVHIYDHSGLELHVLKHHRQPQRLSFLPYHYLLTSIGDAGWLRYQDTSTGQIVAEHRTSLGMCKAMTANPQNAIIHLGHHNGTVTLWSPNMKESLVTMLTHKTNVLDLAVSNDGHTMVTSGLDSQVHCWDLRTYKLLHSYFTVRPTTNVSISQKGMLALGYGPHVTLWKDAITTKQNAPYLSHLYASQSVSDLAFVPYEDILSVGHTGGVGQMIAPGAGFANFDALEVDIFAGKKSRRERVVHSLLDKLQPSMISLSSNIVGLMDENSKKIYEGDRAAMRDARFDQQQKKTVGTNKLRGGQKSSARVRRKRANIVDKASVEIRQAIEKRTREEKERETAAKRANGAPEKPSATAILSRFASKKDKE